MHHPWQQGLLHCHSGPHRVGQLTRGVGPGGAGAALCTGRGSARQGPAHVALPVPTHVPVTRLQAAAVLRACCCRLEIPRTCSSQLDGTPSLAHMQRHWPSRLPAAMWPGSLLPGPCCLLPCGLAPCCPAPVACCHVAWLLAARPPPPAPRPCRWTTSPQCSSSLWSHSSHAAMTLARSSPAGSTTPTPSQSRWLRPRSARASCETGRGR
jgi:hypothetical protein